MSDHIENERIEGEFHHAVTLQGAKADLCFIYRNDDELNPIETHGETTDRASGLLINTAEANAEIAIRRLDQQARHWIEHTQAQNQEAAAENVIRRAAKKYALLLARRVATNPTPFWIERQEELNAALSNNPQVSEPCSTCKDSDYGPGKIGPSATDRLCGGDLRIYDCPDCAAAQVSEGSEAAEKLADGDSLMVTQDFHIDTGLPINSWTLRKRNFDGDNEVWTRIGSAAAELKTLINNCMKQYVVPEGHVAVNLPVEDVAGIAHTGFNETRPDSEDLERFETIYEACRQALSNGEGA